MHKPTSAEEFKLVVGFDAVRKLLLHDRFRDRLDRQLAFWALPNDRRLPLAFLGRTLRDLVETPFEELVETPGVGNKKIGTLIKLLHRATKDHQRMSLDGDGESPPAKKPPATARTASEEFDPAVVSEAIWEQWRETVRKHGVAGEKLGRLAPTLQSLPTVIWHTPLSAYCDYSVAEIRRLKTHGEKRVRTILEVFSSVHEMLAHAKSHGHLAVRLLPKFVGPIDGWIEAVAVGDGFVTPGEALHALVVPLLEQIHLDAGPIVGRLAEGRLGVNGAPQSVRQQSRKMGVTRARVYQLLEDCAKVMAVRWPEGQAKLRRLRSRTEAHPKGGGSTDAIRGAIELFFPDAADLAARAERDGNEE